MRFRARRGATSHTYDEGKAAEMFASIPAFVEEAKFLLSELETRGAAYDP